MTELTVTDTTTTVNTQCRGTNAFEPQLVAKPVASVASAATIGAYIGGTASITSVQDCAQRCLNLHTCRSFSFRETRNGVYYGKCILYSAIAEKTNFKNFWDYYRKESDC
jgi:hypothetical protein